MAENDSKDTDKGAKKTPPPVDVYKVLEDDALLSSLARTDATFIKELAEGVHNPQTPDEELLFKLRAWVHAAREIIAKDELLRQLRDRVLEGQEIIAEGDAVRPAEQDADDKK
jgi:hypothetical protein